MRDDFCAFIISHGRPDKVITYRTLLDAGYTGRVYIVIDDEDATAEKYRQNFPGIVLMFSKAEIAKTFDEGDNSGNRRTTSYVRNACFDLAEQVGCRYFLVLDDDYPSFRYRNPVYKKIRSTFDGLVECLLDFYQKTEVLGLAISQGGDHIGGESLPILRRKAMNFFICSTDRPFKFVGRLNEDVNTYVTIGRCGGLFFTVNQVQLNQNATQATSGGMTEAYMDAGTYVKSFFTVMYAPSCVKVGAMGDPRSGNYRAHHVINWNKAAPKILRESHRKNPRAP